MAAISIRTTRTTTMTVMTTARAMPDRHGSGGHSHSHGPATFDRAFLIGITLNIAFVIVEAVYGFLANSLALVADAGTISATCSACCSPGWPPRSPSGSPARATPTA
jgi:hypothetical protein